MTTEEIADRILARLREERRRQRNEVYVESLSRIAAAAVDTWFLGVRESFIDCTYEDTLGFFDVSIRLDLPWWARRLLWQAFIEASIRMRWLEMTPEPETVGPLVIRFGRLS